VDRSAASASSPSAFAILSGFLVHVLAATFLVSAVPDLSGEHAVDEHKVADGKDDCKPTPNQTGLSRDSG
jgi:hypothetical protein